MNQPQPSVVVAPAGEERDKGATTIAVTPQDPTFTETSVAPVGAPSAQPASKFSETQARRVATALAGAVSPSLLYTSRLRVRREDEKLFVTRMLVVELPTMERCDERLGSGGNEIDVGDKRSAARRTSMMAAQ